MIDQAALSASVNVPSSHSRFQRLRLIWAAIRRTYKRIGHAEARAIMFGAYFVAIGPIALVMGAGRRRRLLVLDDDAGDTAWREIPEHSPQMHSRQQY